MFTNTTMDASVPVSVLVEVLRSIEQKLDSQQQVLSAVIQQQQQLQQQQLLLQRSASCQQDINSASFPSTTAAVAEAAATTAAVAEAAAAAAAAAAAVAGLAAPSAPAAPAADTASTPTTTHATAGGNHQAASCSVGHTPQLDGGAASASHPASQPATGGIDTLQQQPSSTHSAGTAIAAVMQGISLGAQQAAAQAAKVAVAASQHTQEGGQPKHSQTQMEASTSQQQQQQPATQPEAQALRQQQQQQPVSPQHAQKQQAKAAGQPKTPTILVPTPELLIIPGEGSGSSGTTIYNFEDRQLLCNQPREVKQEQPKGCSGPGPPGPLRHKASAFVNPAVAAAAAPGATAAVTQTQQKSSATCMKQQEVVNTPNSAAAAAADTVGQPSHKGSVFMALQQQLLQSCSWETAAELLSISCARGHQDGQSSEAAVKAAVAKTAAAAAGAPKLSKLRLDLNCSEFQSGCSTGGPLLQRTPSSLFVATHDLERFASVDSVTSLQRARSYQRISSAERQQQQQQQAITKRHAQSPQQTGSPPPLVPEQQHDDAPWEDVSSPPLPVVPQQQQQQPSPPQLQPVPASALPNQGRASPPAVAPCTTPVCAMRSSQGIMGWQQLCAGQLPGHDAATATAGGVMPLLGQQGSGSMAAEWEGGCLAGTGHPQMMQQQWQQPGGPQQYARASCQRQQRIGSPRQHWQQVSAVQQPAPLHLHVPQEMQTPRQTTFHQQQQAGQVSTRTVSGPGSGSKAGLSAAAAAAHAAAALAAAAIAVHRPNAALAHQQQVGQPSGSKRKQHHAAGQHERQAKVHRSASTSTFREHSQVPLQRQNSFPGAAGAAGGGLVGPQHGSMMPSTGAWAGGQQGPSGLPQPQQPAVVQPLPVLNQLPSWLLQQAYNTFMPGCGATNAAAKPQQQDEPMDGRDALGLLSPAASVALPAATPRVHHTAEPGGGGSSSIGTADIIGDTADLFADDAPDWPMGSDGLPPLAPTMAAAAAEAGVILPSGASTLDPQAAAGGEISGLTGITCGSGAPSACDGLGPAVLVPTGGFMQLLTEGDSIFA